MLRRKLTGPTRRSVVGLTVTLTIVLSACGTRSATGTITGSVDIVGGGTEYRTVPGSGRLVIREGKRPVARVHVSSGHPFGISLPVGTYEITASVPNAPCQSGDILAQEPRLGPVKVTVTVVANKTSRVGWSCPIPSAIG
jgi:hypothetical protein